MRWCDTPEQVKVKYVHDILRFRDHHILKQPTDFLPELDIDTMADARAFANKLQLAGTRTLHSINQNTPEHNMIVLPIPKMDHYTLRQGPH